MILQVCKSWQSAWNWETQWSVMPWNQSRGGKNLAFNLRIWIGFHWNLGLFFVQYFDSPTSNFQCTNDLRCLLDRVDLQNFKNIVATRVIIIHTGFQILNNLSSSNLGAFSHVSICKWHPSWMALSKHNKCLIDGWHHHAKFCESSNPTKCML